MNLTREKLRLRLSRLIPESLGRAGYSGVLEAVRALGRLHGIPASDIWARHSFVLGAFTPLASDLDLTAWVGGRLSEARLRKFLARYELLRLAFPILGEINVIVEKQMRPMVGIANPLELARDPELLRRLGVSRDAELGERAAFLLRLAQSDVYRLRHMPETRAEKWRRHFRAAGLHPLDELSLAAVLEAVAELLGMKGARADAFRTKIADYLENSPPVPHSPEIDIDPIVCHAFPHRLGFRPELLRPVRADIAPLYLAQLRWDLWGLMTQYRQILLKKDSRISLKQHLKNLRTAVAHVARSLPAARKLKTHLDTLRKAV